MTQIDPLLLTTIAGGADEYPNERRVQIDGLKDSLDRPVSDFVCWDSKSSSDYQFCAPASTVNLPGGHGNPWLIPKSFIASHSR